MPAGLPIDVLADAEQPQPVRPAPVRLGVTVTAIAEHIDVSHRSALAPRIGRGLKETRSGIEITLALVRTSEGMHTQANICFRVSAPVA